MYHEAVAVVLGLRHSARELLVRPYLIAHRPGLSLLESAIQSKTMASVSLCLFDSV
jgi:hypothetical protein